MADEFDTRQFRNALGTFATGVTVVTTRAPDGSPVGMAVNSFSSVSLDPPLILWSIAHAASLWQVFQAADWFAVHVLAADQAEVSNRFASSTDDRFAGVDLDAGLGDVPVLTDCVACFECRTEARHPGGDHAIVVGRVERFRYDNRAPLIFHGGRYAALAAEPDA